jgi:hypothetical protein
MLQFALRICAGLTVNTVRQSDIDYYRTKMLIQIAQFNKDSFSFDSLLS